MSFAGFMLCEVNLKGPKDNAEASVLEVEELVEDCAVTGVGVTTERLEVEGLDS